MQKYDFPPLHAPPLPPPPLLQIILTRLPPTPQVQGAMSALHNALLPPHPLAAVSPQHVVNQKKVAQSVADLTKIALQLHLKQLEVKQRALHPEPSSPMAFVQQHPLDIHAPGQHMPRAVAAIVKGSHTPLRLFFTK